MFCKQSEGFNLILRSSAQQKSCKPTEGINHVLSSSAQLSQLNLRKCGHEKSYHGSTTPTQPLVQYQRTGAKFTVQSRCNRNFCKCTAYNRTGFNSTSDYAHKQVAIQGTEFSSTFPHV